ncbi:hypothetical protein [Cytophaga hutchinsonii]|uniref:Uncharacterized protein n=1 Tax=Cytophaga hutchinsonii (strain ATCC 33406 / DSM 1761 / CIP 103989 / NBRC 15051 / NCIMB 9469 / D465) TaxID=269798 RepID=A0A6N4SUY1_CYTH3|nr:hypothetical protein [Cytophaga hutchinsonii]ABG60195.1 hypothetical protein CHU_2953 [Cytophaga hutchinsonii ATCC 33406]SFX22220.1 hypothetical protein SAMN04487930_102108 [Cytophaga hutchinsonii ATCC 33406]
MNTQVKKSLRNNVISDNHCEIYYLNKKDKVQVRYIFVGLIDEAIKYASENWLDEYCYFILVDKEMTAVMAVQNVLNKKKLTDEKTHEKAIKSINKFSLLNGSILVENENGRYKEYLLVGDKNK